MSEAKANKRKRLSEDGTGSARKKTAAGPGFTEKTKVIHRNNDETSVPVIATAAGLSIPVKASFGAYHRRAPSGHELLLHSSDHPRIDYTASEVQDGGAAVQKLKHYVGIFDPATKTVQLIPARGMSVRSTIRAETEEARRAVEERELNGLSKRQALGLEFGTKRAKKVIESLSQNAVSQRKRGEPETESGADPAKHNPDAAAVLESMAAAADAAPTKEAMQAEVDESKPRPKHNPDAEDPPDVYPIEDVVGEATMLSIKVRPWVEATERGESVKTKSRFVARRIQALAKQDQIPQLKVLKYVGVLLDFYAALKPKKGAGRVLPPKPILDKEVGEPANVIETIKAKFTDGKGAMTKWHVDLLMTHLAVYSLIVDNYSTDMYDLAQDLGKETKEMKPYFKEIGAKCERLKESEWVKAGLNKDQARNHMMGKLVLPLEFPKQRAPPQARGRK